MTTKNKYGPPKKEYIEGNINSDGEVVFLTIAELAQKYNIKLSTLQRHCQNESWVRLRADFQAEAERLARDKAAKKRAKDIERFDVDCFKITKSGIWRLSNDMGKDIEASRKKLPMMSLQDLESLARSLERFQTVGHRALGVPDKATAISGPDNGPLELKVTTWADIIRQAAEDDLKDANREPDNPQ